MEGVTGIEITLVAKKTEERRWRLLLHLTLAVGMEAKIAEKLPQLKSARKETT